jgi:hypothetical protein
VPIGILVLLLDIFLIAHAARTGRFMPWGLIIILLPGIGAIIYVVAELAPTWFGSHQGRALRGSVARVVDPEARYRRLTDDLAVADTIANRAALAHECLTLGKFDEARAHYDLVIAKPHGDEPQFYLGKARAQNALGDPAGCVATLEALMRLWPNFQSFDGHLLYAIALEDCGRFDEALANYAGVGQYYPGPEPRVRQAELLRRLGREADARALAEEVLRGLERAPPYVRRNHRAWFASAQKLARG